METHSQTSWLLKLTCVIWLAFAALGFCSLLAYSQTPSAAETTHLEGSPAKDSWTLAVGIHPQCPCTFATLSELERLLAKAKGQLHCKIYAYCPADFSDGERTHFLDTLLIHQARSLPNTELIIDQESDYAMEMGIATSGGCVLYDQSGGVRFRGGITPSRGHEGDNLGSRTILALLRGEESEIDATPVYGCLLTGIIGGQE